MSLKRAPPPDSGPARAGVSRQERALRGRRAESLAAAHLERAGLTIVARNYRCKAGELDLVAREGRTLVFVEVRFRSSDRFGGAAASIDRAKRARLVRAAEHYLLGRPAPACRFDAVLVTGSDVQWIRNAFDD